MTPNDYLALPTPDVVRDGRQWMNHDGEHPAVRASTHPHNTASQMLLFASPTENLLRFYILSRGFGGGDLGQE